jgi:hypothetical protein
MGKKKSFEILVWIIGQFSKWKDLHEMKCPKFENVLAIKEKYGMNFF